MTHVDSKSGFSPTQNFWRNWYGIFPVTARGGHVVRNRLSVISHHVLRRGVAKDLSSHHGRHPGARFVGNGWGMGSIGEHWGATIFSMFQKGQCV